jgi:hypothetical protein
VTGPTCQRESGREGARAGATDGWGRVVSEERGVGRGGRERWAVRGAWEGGGETWAGIGPAGGGEKRNSLFFFSYFQIYFTFFFSKISFFF